MALPVAQNNDTSKALQSTIPKHAMVDFIQGGIQWLGDGVNKTINFLIGSKWPKAKMITHDISLYEEQLIENSKDILL